MCVCSCIGTVMFWTPTFSKSVIVIKQGNRKSQCGCKRAERTPDTPTYHNPPHPRTAFSHTIVHLIKTEKLHYLWIGYMRRLRIESVSFSGTNLIGKCSIRCNINNVNSVFVFTFIPYVPTLRCLRLKKKYVLLKKTSEHSTLQSKLPPHHPRWFEALVWWAHSQPGVRRLLGHLLLLEHRKVGHQVADAQAIPRRFGGVGGANALLGRAQTWLRKDNAETQFSDLRMTMSQNALWFSVQQWLATWRT